MFSRRIFTIFSFIIAFHLSCSRRSTPGPVPAVAHRIVSLSPSTTEALFAIGAGDLVVGRSRFCDYPPQVLALPIVGDYIDANLERVLSLRPDLLTAARTPAREDFAKRVEARGVATYLPSTDSFAQIEAMLTELGKRTGHADGARAAIQRLRDRVAGVARAVRGQPRKRVLLVFGTAPIVVAGPSGFSTEMLNAAGGENVIRKGPPFPAIGVEQLLALDPDVILDAAAGESHGDSPIDRDAPGWRELRAVRTGHVVEIRDESVLRPGPRIGDGVAALARALHPL